MFGHHYFGARYYGPRYWGDGGSGIPIPPPATTTRLTGTGGWGASLGWPLSKKPSAKRDEEENRRHREIEALERAIDAAWQKAFPVAATKPEVALPAIPTVDWEAIETQKRAFEQTKRELQSTLERIDALAAQQADEEDVEILMMFL